MCNSYNLCSNLNLDSHPIFFIQFCHIRIRFLTLIEVFFLRHSFSSIFTQTDPEMFPEYFPETFRIAKPGHIRNFRNGMLAFFQYPGGNQPVDTRPQKIDTERFCPIVIRADFQPFQHVLFISQCSRRSTRT